MLSSGPVNNTISQNAAQSDRVEQQPSDSPIDTVSEAGVIDVIDLRDESETPRLAQSAVDLRIGMRCVELPLVHYFLLFSS